MQTLLEFCKFNKISNTALKELMSKNSVSEKDIVVFNPYDFCNDILSREGITELNKYIKSNQNIYLPKYTIFFHSTGFNLKSIILEEGLLPTSEKRRRSYQSTPGYVYLAWNRESAEMFGSLGNGSKIITFAVLVKTTDMGIDTDQLRNKKSANPQLDIKQTLGDSIIFGNGIRVKGKIFPYGLVVI